MALEKLWMLVVGGAAKNQKKITDGTDRKKKTVKKNAIRPGALDNMKAEHGRPNRRKSDEHAKCSIDTRMETRNNSGTDRPDTPEKPTRKRTKKAAEPLPII